MGSGLVTDLYELTMAASYLRRGMTQPATFSLFARKLPPGRGFLAAAGVADVVRLLEDHRLDDADARWLAEAGFAQHDIAALRELRFTGDVWAIPEGHVVFPDEPLLEVTAPLPEAQLVETVVLNQVTYQTCLATKAARCALAAAGRAALVDFSARRTHGIEASIAAARAGAIAGFAGTSNAHAARLLGIPAAGTMAHSYIEAFPSEREAFRAFAEDFPERSTFLVDTYDTMAGIEVAIEVIDALGIERNPGIRLDSGDLLDLSVRARRRLDAAGHPEVRIVASGGLDEYDVQWLLDRGAPIDVFGVGTRIGVSADAPSLDTAYKLVDYAGRPVMKLSPGKETRPGAKQVYRGDEVGDDVLATRAEAPPPGMGALLVPVMRAGRPVAPPEPLDAIAERLRRDLASLPPPAKDLRAPEPVAVRISAALQTLTREVRDASEAPLRSGRGL